MNSSSVFSDRTEGSSGPKEDMRRLGGFSSVIAARAGCAPGTRARAKGLARAPLFVCDKLVRSRAYHVRTMPPPVGKAHDPACAACVGARCARRRHATRSTLSACDGGRVRVGPPAPSSEIQILTGGSAALLREEFLLGRRPQPPVKF